jgi:hypothetical protein
MRTTVTLADDVAAAVQRLQRDEGVGLSDALNRLVRRGLVAKPDTRGPFVQQTVSLDLKMDVRNIEEALEIAEGPGHR